MIGRSAMESQDPELLGTDLVYQVGRVILNWTIIEVTLVGHLSIMAGTEQFRSRVIWASMPNLRARCTLLNHLAGTFVDESVLPQYRRLLKRVGRLGSRRNILAHSLNFTNVEPGKVTFVQDVPSEELGFDFVGRKDFQFENIKSWADAIKALHLDLVKFAFVLEKNVHRPPKMHRVDQADKES